MQDDVKLTLCKGSGNFSCGRYPKAIGFPTERTKASNNFVGARHLENYTLQAKKFFSGRKIWIRGHKQDRETTF